MDEQALIQRCRAGDMAAFELLLGRYESLVFNLARRYFGRQPEAADIAQEAMVKIFNHINDFKGKSSFKTWVYRVVTNICLDTLRKRRLGSFSLEQLEEEGRYPRNRETGLCGNPEELAESSELREILTDLMATLAEDHRVILVLRDMEGLSYEEISEVLNCSLGTVKSRLARAREALRRKFLASPQSAGWVEGRLQA